MKTYEEYVDSLRERDLELYRRGERIENPVDHDVVRPSIRTIGQSYKLANDPDFEDILVAHSPYIDGPVNRFTHIFESEEALHKKQTMQRILGRVTGTCFQRCVGMDALNAVYNLTYSMDRDLGTEYHGRFLEYLKYVQKNDYVLCGAMTDPKGDRTKRPHEEPDKYLRVTERNGDSIVLNGAKMHQTGIVNSHEIMVMPGSTLREEDEDFAVVCSMPVDTDGITLIYGRKPNDERRIGCDIDTGQMYDAQEAVAIFDDVEVPKDRVFMLGEHEYTKELVDTFAHHHRHSYGGCKPGNGDALIGSAAEIARLNGVDDASHIKDKLAEMVQLNETMYGCGVSCASNCEETEAGTVMVDRLLANVTKQHVTRNPYEMIRKAEDIAGGLMATMPAEEDLDHPDYGPDLRNYIEAAEGDSEDRQRILRLLEDQAFGSTAVALRTESMHGAGSPMAQKIRIMSQANFDIKRSIARNIAGLEPIEETGNGSSGDEDDGGTNIEPEALDNARDYLESTQKTNGHPMDSDLARHHPLREKED